MVQITVLKKCLRWVKGAFLAAFVCLFWVEISLGVTPSSDRIPTLHYVGVIPVQWQVQNRDASLMQAAEKYWYEVTKDAGRFRLINNEVVGEMWSSPAGRASLVRQYELHGFLSLEVTSLRDVVVFTARLLSPTLAKTYLHEVETVSSGFLYSADEDDIHQILENLVFRMLNRLPIDTTVTSVQGAYITLSGGSNQNMKVDTSLKIERAKVVDVHPATGAWLKFDKKLLGKARVIQVGLSASIAKITHQTHEGAIKVLDGARIDLLPSRVKFLRMKEKEDFYSENIDEIPILYPPPKKKKIFRKSQEVVVKAAPTALPGEQEGEDEEEEATPKEVEEESEEEESEEEESEQKEKEAETSFTPLKGANDALWVHGGPRIWNASGSNGVNVSSSIDPWLINSISARGVFLLTENIGIEPLGNLSFGKTAAGSFVGFAIGTRVFYRLHLSGTTNLDLGAMTKYQSFGVTGERYGGEDVLKIGAYASYQDRFLLEDSAIAYFADFDLMPMAIGKVGTRGQKRDITAYFAFHLSLGAVMEEEDPEALEWGGMFLYGSDAYTMDSRNLTISDLYLAGLVRMRI